MSYSFVRNEIVAIPTSIELARRLQLFTIPKYANNRHSGDVDAKNVIL